MINVYVALLYLTILVIVLYLAKFRMLETTLLLLIFLLASTLLLSVAAQLLPMIKGNGFNSLVVVLAVYAMCNVYIVPALFIWFILLLLMGRYNGSNSAGSEE